MENEYEVSKTIGDSVIIGHLPAHALSKEQALKLAAWLVYHASGLRGKGSFNRFFKQIKDHHGSDH